MQQISVVIITKNEALNIIDCINSAKMVSNDIIVIDSGSTDGTVTLAKQQNVRVEPILWRGYGSARNTGAILALNDWILSLDADERITGELGNSISSMPLTDPNIIYGFRRMNYFGHTRIKYGELSHDRVFRLYNKHHSQWNLVPVHEMLVGQNPKRTTLKPKAAHYGIRTRNHYYQKKMGYAALCALKYLHKRKRFVRALQVLSPGFSFIKSYIFQLGFLDQRIGFIISRINAQYSRKKYQQLELLLEQEEKQIPEFNFVRSSMRKIISFLS
ncbi:MAG: glycosyltransferase family 2 protein [Ferruginibacter sp.]